jgi:hypothetical protein
MILHLFVIWVIFLSLYISSYAHLNVKNKNKGLKKDKSPKFSMIKFTYTASDPKTMMIIFLNTSIAIIAMFCSIRQFFNPTDFTTSIFWNLNFSYMTKWWLIFYFLVNDILLLYSFLIFISFLQMITIILLLRYLKIWSLIFFIFFLWTQFITILIDKKLILISPSRIIACCQKQINSKSMKHKI